MWLFQDYFQRNTDVLRCFGRGWNWTVLGWKVRFLVGSAHQWARLFEITNGLLVFFVLATHVLGPNLSSLRGKEMNSCVVCVVCRNSSRVLKLVETRRPFSRKTIENDPRVVGGFCGWARFCVWGSRPGVLLSLHHSQEWTPLSLLSLFFVSKLCGVWFEWWNT